MGIAAGKTKQAAVKTMPDADKPTVTHTWLFELMGRNPFRVISRGLTLWEYSGRASSPRRAGLTRLASEFLPVEGLFSRKQSGLRMKLIPDGESEK